MARFTPLFQRGLQPLAQKYLDTATPCPQCDADNRHFAMMIEEEAMRPRYAVACLNCNLYGPIAKNVPQAVKKWNPPTGFIASLKKKLVFT
jgi:hypothetical protein